MCFYYGYEAEVTLYRVVKARKVHACDECVDGIAPGTKYALLNVLYDGSWQVFRTCMSCESLRQAIHEHELAEGCGWDESWCPSGETWDAAIERRLVDRVGKKEPTSEYHWPEKPGMFTA